MMDRQAPGWAVPGSLPPHRAHWAPHPPSSDAMRPGSLSSHRSNQSHWPHRGGATGSMEGSRERSPPSEWPLREADVSGACKHSGRGGGVLPRQLTWGTWSRSKRSVRRAQLLSRCPERGTQGVLGSRGSSGPHSPQAAQGGCRHCPGALSPHCWPGGHWALSVLGRLASRQGFRPHHTWAGHSRRGPTEATLGDRQTDRLGVSKSQGCAHPPPARTPPGREAPWEGPAACRPGLLEPEQHRTQFLQLHSEERGLVVPGALLPGRPAGGVDLVRPPPPAGSSSWVSQGIGVTDKGRSPLGTRTSDPGRAGRLARGQGPLAPCCSPGGHPGSGSCCSPPPRSSRGGRAPPGTSRTCPTRSLRGEEAGRWWH